MADEVLKNFANPAYWREVIDDDENASCRSEWIDQIEKSEDLLNNRTSFGVGDYEIAPSEVHKIRKYLLGHMAFGKMDVRVTGTEEEDREVADMYRDLIKWEFTRPRGIDRKIGRDELRYTFENWIDYGLGDFNTYFNPYVRDEENWNGSIINESVNARGIILDSSAERFIDIGYFARKQMMRQDKIASMFPFYKGDMPLDKSGKCYVYDVQFRTTRPVTVRLNTSEVAEQIGDYRPFWKDEEKARFIDAFGEKRNKEAEKIWKSFKSDMAFIPVVYSIVFLGDNKSRSKTELVRGPTFVGHDYSHTLIPFAEVPGSPYPVGMTFFIYDLVMIRTYLISLYLELASNMNNSGGVLNIDKIHGLTTDDKLDEVRKMMKEKNYWIPASGVQNMNEVALQFRRMGPDRSILEARELTGHEIDSIFNTYPSQIGRIEYSGQPARLAELLQSVGSFPLVDLADRVRQFMTSVYTKTAYLVHEYMPPQKRIAVSNMAGDKEFLVIEKEKVQKVNPLLLDITVELDVETEREKADKAIKAFELFDRQVISKRELLLRTGEENPERVLSELEDEALGRLIVNTMKLDPKFGEAVKEGLNISMLQQKAEGKP
jgi:hypothetical protein